MPTLIILAAVIIVGAAFIGWEFYERKIFIETAIDNPNANTIKKSGLVSDKTIAIINELKNKEVKLNAFMRILELSSKKGNISIDTDSLDSFIYRSNLTFSLTRLEWEILRKVTAKTYGFNI